MDGARGVFRMIAYTDGATLGKTKTGEPSPIGAGIVFHWTGHGKGDETGPLHTICEPLGLGTSNDAEWQALILAVEWWLVETNASFLEVRSDSQLIVNQANRKFVIRKSNLQGHAKRWFWLKKMATKLDRRIKVRWIPREENKHADKISKEAARLNPVGVDTGEDR